MKTTLKYQGKEYDVEYEGEGEDMYIVSINNVPIEDYNCTLKWYDDFSSALEEQLADEREGAEINADCSEQMTRIQEEK